MKYTPTTKSICDRINTPVKLVAAIQVYNEEEFIQLNLDAHYQKFDRLLIIEGAVKNNASARSIQNFHSTDKTLDIIKSYPDPSNKIKLIQIDRYWESLEEMKNRFLEELNSGDILCIIDADEFYHENDIDRIRKAFDLYPWISEIIVSFRHFYGDFNHIAKPAPDWSCQHQRIIKFQKGMKYLSHPILTDSDGMCTYFSPQYQPFRVLPKTPIYIDHFGYARLNMDDRMRAKKDYYDRELSKHGSAHAEFAVKLKKWFDKTEKVLSFDRNLVPPAMMRHPNFSLILSDLNVVSEWTQDRFYADKIGNIDLCMTGQSSPSMAYFRNEIDL